MIEMTDQHKKELIEIIDRLCYGKIVIKKEAGKVVVIKRTESIKLCENSAVARKGE